MLNLGIYLSLAYNICFVFDFHITLNCPLISGTKRGIYYNIFSVFIIVISFIQFPFISGVGMLEQVLSCFFLVIGIFTIIFGKFKMKYLKNLEMENSGKFNSYLNLHIFYVLFLVIVDGCIIFVEFYDDDNEN